jgi:pyruvate kinase
MLSGESASGKYPVEAVRFMRRIIEESENSPFDDIAPSRDPLVLLPQATAHTLKDLALGGHIDAALALQSVGPWTETLLSARPEISLYLAVPSETLMRQNNIRWGVRPFVISKSSVEQVLAWLKRHRWIRKGDRLAVVAGEKHGKGVDVIQVK